MDEILYSWKFSTKKERSQIWYTIALSIAIGLVIWGFLTSQYMMSFVILLLTGVVYFMENNSEDEIEISITPHGILIGNTFYDYPKISSFGFIYNKEKAFLLRLKMAKHTLPFIDLQVDNTITSRVKDILKKFLTEEESLELSFTDKMIRFLKL